MSKIAKYRQQMIARKAAKAGLSIAEFLARGEADAQLASRAWELRCDRRSGWHAIALRAQATGRGWVVCW